MHSVNDQSTNLHFGFLISPLAANFNGITLTPLPDHAERLESVLNNSNLDGFFYPPQVATFTRSKSNERIKIPQTERPAAVYHLPASHELSIAEPFSTNHPNSDAILIIQALAFIFGTRLQLQEWMFEGRVPVKSRLAASINDETRLNFVEHTYSWWRKIPLALKSRVINVFYAYNRAIAMEWDWDAFSQQYIVFDALFRLHAEISPSKTNIPHKMRFNILCQEYGIPHNDNLVSQLYKARNELFHEGIWANAMIGHQAPGSDASQYPSHLSRLNARLLCAITGYKNTFTDSAWWAMGQFHFDKSDKP